MKNRLLSAVIFTLLGAFVVFGPSVLFPVCGSDEMKMSCYYTKQAEIGIGFVIAILGVFIFFFKDVKIRIGISAAQAINAILVFAYPLWLTGLCGMKSMACHVRALPALIVASVFLLIIAVINILYLSVKGQEA